MFVNVKLNDGTVIKPVFEPSETNLEQVPVFYKNQADSFQIQNFIITLDNGKTLALGGRF
jgi:hypothetical protein